jgi:hypothetical protein
MIFAKLLGASATSVAIPSLMAFCLRKLDLNLKPKSFENTRYSSNSWLTPLPDISSSSTGLVLIRDLSGVMQGSRRLDR